MRERAKIVAGAWQKREKRCAGGGSTEGLARRGFTAPMRAPKLTASAPLATYPAPFRRYYKVQVCSLPQSRKVTVN